MVPHFKDKWEENGESNRGAVLEGHFFSSTE